MSEKFDKMRHLLYNTSMKLKYLLARMKKTEDVTEYSRTLRYDLRNRTYKLGNFHAAILKCNDPDIPTYHPSVYCEHEQPKKFDEDDINMHHGSTSLEATLTLFGAKHNVRKFVARQDDCSCPRKDLQ